MVELHNILYKVKKKFFGDHLRKKKKKSKKKKIEKSSKVEIFTMVKIQNIF